MTPKIEETPQVEGASNSKKEQQNEGRDEVYTYLKRGEVIESAPEYASFPPRCKKNKRSDNKVYWKLTLAKRLQ
ncbi:hypothetical protein ATZ36_07805 [Candidatus Endomicrobiellum trichonymphae]|uniref:Uncharacterized protein n=1 Tax=Endomicrobium trichonymphae TaxID=1408204 RepID=A0A1E5IGV2_ENDTX|nr:hypothetical protein ATZ36_07805 [Candidatus Endomicrobium trichonymphae]